MPRGVKAEVRKFDPFNVASSAIKGGVADRDIDEIRDVEEFVLKYCYTLDPHDSANPIKLFPRHPYISEILRLYKENDLLLIAKSRQLMVSWLCVAIGLHEALTNPGRLVFFVSKKEDDAGYTNELSLLSRAMFMYERLPGKFKTEVWKGLQPPVLRFPHQSSSIQGVSQDSDALRQYTASLIICDEWAFQERAERSYAAMRPTLQGGGKCIGISTPNGKTGLFFRLVHDVQE